MPSGSTAIFDLSNTKLAYKDGELIFALTDIRLLERRRYADNDGTQTLQSA